MEANNRTPAISSKIGVIEECISAKDIDKAKALMNELEQETDSSQTTLVRLRAIINRLEIIGR